ncbi:hypothetical protein [Plebeiibacterium marinum]|uniref:Uncharacterized protein n=1 Tax=Plebeiibacterium marinum TaxID=2992111 RepID=A0AAE3MGI7_9BACT|nr:hypothetical protein [Plebeiobacterium marinum]MCW3807237.1 hypothetical protein [Plebeiobacterium marinum]
MTKNNKYGHIRSFKDFENEKILLHYQIKLAEKKLEIKQLELKEYINPIRFFTSMFNEIYRPAFDLLRSVIMHFVEKHKEKINEEENKGK